jgi:bla regulator protein BlaR1
MPPLEVAPAPFSSSEAPLPLPPAQAIRPSVPWKTWCFYTWLAGLIYFGLRLLWTNLRFAARIAGAKQPSAHIAEIFNEGRESLGVARSVALAETDSVETPCVYGLFTKRVLLPAGFSDRFSPDELRHVFRHELAHIKRRDLEVNWIVALLAAVHWFNPVLWFAFARMRADREIATDALALSVDQRKRAEDYGETILKVLETFTRNAELPQVVGIVESKSRVKERIRAIARHGMVRTSSALGIGVVCVLVCFTFTAAVQEQPKKSVEAPQA